MIFEMYTRQWQVVRRANVAETLRLSKTRTITKYIVINNNINIISVVKKKRNRFIVNTIFYVDSIHRAVNSVTIFETEIVITKPQITILYYVFYTIRIIV